MDERLEQFQCRSPGNCLMKLDKGLTDDYGIEGTRVMFRGAEIGDLQSMSLEDIICGGHCDLRFLDEVVCVHSDKQRFRVVKKHSI